jgi:predicted phosphodiesterase
MRDFGWERLRGVFPRTAQWGVGEWMAVKNPDLFVHLGDIIYSHDQLPAYKEAFFRPFEAVLSHTTLVATLGNHDMHTWEHPEFFRVFHTPKPLDPKQKYKDFSHTFTWGSVRFLVLDAFWQTWEPGSEMRQWLEEILGAKSHPRTIVIMHTPAYSDEAGLAENELLQKRLWPLFVQAKVALVISGDSHSYQRFKPIGGVTQVVVGTGGKSIRPVAARRLAHKEERFGFLLVKVTGTRIEGEFWASGETPLDRFDIPE